jgi:copper oxidase (laccase) domain-containing protein
MTADCLPALFCNRPAPVSRRAHAGWRGLAAGVLEAALDSFDAPPKILVWLGPAIGPQAFEVGLKCAKSSWRSNYPKRRSLRTERQCLASSWPISTSWRACVWRPRCHGCLWRRFLHRDNDPRFFSYRRARAPVVVGVDPSDTPWLTR